MKNKNTIIIVLAFVLALFSGCVSQINVPPSPDIAWDDSVKVLGPVTAKHGRWPLSLKSPPPAETYYVALRTTAASTFGVRESDVVLRDVSVQIGAEMDGTIRDWKATAVAGQRAGGASVAATKSTADALMELKKLLDAGAISPAEYEAKKKVLIDKL